METQIYAAPAVKGLNELGVIYESCRRLRLIIILLYQPIHGGSSSRVGSQQAYSRRRTFFSPFS